MTSEPDEIPTEHYEMTTDNLPHLIKELAASNEFLKNTGGLPPDEIAELVEEFKRAFPGEDGKHTFSNEQVFKWWESICNDILDRTLLDLVDRGCLNMSFKDGDFIYTRGPKWQEPPK